MPNLMDNTPFSSGTPSQSVATPGANIFEILQRAKSDPMGFENMIKQMNPEGYQRAMQIRNCANPRAMTIEMAKARGINPNILSMLGIN